MDHLLILFRNRFFTDPIFIKVFSDSWLTPNKCFVFGSGDNIFQREMIRQIRRLSAFHVAGIIYVPTQDIRQGYDVVGRHRLSMWPLFVYLHVC